MKLAKGLGKLLRNFGKLYRIGKDQRMLAGRRIKMTEETSISFRIHFFHRKVKAEGEIRFADSDGRKVSHSGGPKRYGDNRLNGENHGGSSS